MRSNTKSALSKIIQRELQLGPLLTTDIGRINKIVEDIADYIDDDMDWLARKEGIVRDDDYRGIEVRDTEPTIEYLDRRIDVLNAEMRRIDKLRNFYIDTLNKKVHEG